MTEQKIAKRIPFLICICAKRIFVWLIFLDAEQICHICPDFISAFSRGQDIERETNALRQHAAHLHCFDPEFLWAKELKLRPLWENCVGLNKYSKIARSIFVLADDDLPSLHNSQDDSIPAIDWSDGFNFLDACELSQNLTPFKIFSSYNKGNIFQLAFSLRAGETEIFL